MTLILALDRSELTDRLVIMFVRQSKALLTTSVSILAGKLDEGEESVQRSVLRVDKGLFADSAAVLPPAVAAADVTLPAVEQWPLNSLTAETTLQLLLQLSHHHQTIIDNTAA